MSSRENSVMWLGLGAAGVLVAFVGYALVWSPLQDAEQRRAEAEETLNTTLEKLDRQKRANAQLAKLMPRLELAEKLSLPPRPPTVKGSQSFRSPQDQMAAHLHHLGQEYESYLNTLLIEAGFKEIEVKARPAPAQIISSKKKTAAPYEPLVFTVSSRGEQKALYTALRNFHKTNLLHVVRNVTVEVARPKSREKMDPNVLTMNMTVEALVLRGGQVRGTLMPTELPKQPEVLASLTRDYSLLEKRSPFTGLKDPPPPPREKPKLVEKKDPPPKRDDPPRPSGPPPISISERLGVLEFVKVTMVAYNPVRRRWEATLYDQAQGNSDEMRLDERLYKTFQLYNGEERMVWEGKVVFIGWPIRVGEDKPGVPTPEPVVIFEADKKFYRAKVGDFLDTVYRNPISDKEAIEMGLKKG